MNGNEGSQARRLILASASPRRHELLSLLRLPFEVVVSDVDEDIDGTPAGIARVLAERKAEAVGKQFWGEFAIIIGADTVVSVDLPDPVSLAKPADANDARRMLRMLSGRAHTVHTGIALTQTFPMEHRDLFTTTRTVVDTQVTFRKLTDAMIEAYIATGEPYDKAGAYGIQGYASAFVEAVYGDYFNIVGLPVATVGRMLEEVGVEWWRGPRSLDI